MNYYIKISEHNKHCNYLNCDVYKEMVFMIQNFRVLNIKDTENPSETILSNIVPSNVTAASTKNITANTSSQQEIIDNFDTFIEKRNKES